MSTNPQHPFDREDGPDVISIGGSRVAIRPPQPKASEFDNIRRELDRAARQLEGLSKSLKRLNDRVKEAT